MRTTLSSSYWGRLSAAGRTRVRAGNGRGAGRRVRTVQARRRYTIMWSRKSVVHAPRPAEMWVPGPAWRPVLPGHGFSCERHIPIPPRSAQGWKEAAGNAVRRPRALFRRRFPTGGAAEPSRHRSFPQLHPGQPRRAASLWEQPLAVAVHHGGALPASRLQDRRQLDAARDHVLRRAHAGAVP